MFHGFKYFTNSLAPRNELNRIEELHLMETPTLGVSSLIAYLGALTGNLSCKNSQ